MGIAEPAIAAAQQHEPLIRLRQIGEHGFLVVVEDLRPDRDAQHEVAAIGAGPVGPCPAAAVLRPEMLLIAVIDQRVQVVGRDKDDIAALAAHTAIRPAELNELLAAKAHRAAAAITALEVDLALIEEFHGIEQTKKGSGWAAPLAFRRLGKRLFGGLRRSRLDRNIGTTAKAFAELHRALFKREQRVVAAHADTLAGMKLGAALAHDDVAGDHDLAAEFLDAEPPAGAVAAVAGRAACLFMRHPEPPAPALAAAPLLLPARPAGSR